MNIIALFVIGLGASIAPLDFSVNVAFPAISEAFSLPTQSILWIPFSYVLTYGVLVIGFGALGDRLGHLRVFRAGLVLAIIALTLCALAPTYPWLIAARVLQGVAMALTLSCAPAIVTFLYDETQRTRALSLYGSMTAIASVAAPLIGGLMVAWMDWPGVYWFRVPIAIIALAFLPLLAPRLKANALNRGMSTAQTKPSTLRLLFHTSREDKRFLWINIVSAVLQLSTFAIPLLVPYYLSTVAAWPAERIGMVLGCWASGTLLGSMLTGIVSKRWPSNLIAYGAAWICTSGLICVMLWSDVPNWSLIFFSMILHGLGLGLFQVAYADWIVACLPRQARGVAGGITVFTRTVGVVTGAMFWLWVLQLAESSSYVEAMTTKQVFISGFKNVFLCAASLIAACLIFTALRTNLWQRTPQENRDL
ncbi:MFS transporter [Alcaligenaceae bacterium LF4-65]|uniref:MFS transporter n=1 Tax=Zwartia hollandica TaxID=324606 RepID=A0A953T7K2_9BURK|nr:MFS transporter [Zwartia hollandica]MBZ1350779.1 MFS transporter [Zwartia hollandica]